MVDEGRIALRPAVELSYLGKLEQQDLAAAIGLSLATPSHTQAIKLRTVLSFVMIMTVYGRFCKLYLYSAIAPIPLSSFAGEPSQNVGRSFLKSYAAVCLEGAIIVLSCIIFSHFAASPPTVKTDAAAVTMVWSYIGEVIFNMLILVGSVKMADRIVREMMGL